ncbi:hypothetical protein HDU96_006501 [Phlyctochytrium bullatum]|nr:hypothetical protein HDU96_006501 [Phlyctochytrium bullatum]
MATPGAPASTSVKVALRVRPVFDKDKAANPRASREVVSVPPAGADAEGPRHVVVDGRKRFTYDRVFPPSASQENIYRTCVKDMVERFVGGFNSTVMAYGQTGTGKTYTMGSSKEQIPLGGTSFPGEGIISRAVRDLFQLIAAKQSAPGGAETTFTVSSTFLEVYNEDLIDLLSPQQGSRTPVIIQETGSGMLLSGCTVVKLKTAEEALSLFLKGLDNRQTSTTALNTSSSRSHAIFTLTLVQESRPSPDAKPVTISSKFHFVDLAGSERLKRTGAIGARQREGISLNTGLLALGNVISALSDDSGRKTHVPYRDSKLTRLLQDSLGGNSNTLMIACISPIEHDLGETLNTLKYANRAHKVRNLPTMNKEVTDDETQRLRDLVEQLREEVRVLKSAPPSVSEAAATLGLTPDVEMLYKENQSLKRQLEERKEENLRLRAHRDYLANELAFMQSQSTLRLIGSPAPSDALSDVYSDTESLVSNTTGISSIVDSESVAGSTTSSRIPISSGKRASKRSSIPRPGSTGPLSLSGGATATNTGVTADSLAATIDEQDKLIRRLRFDLREMTSAAQDYLRELEVMRNASDHHAAAVELGEAQAADMRETVQELRTSLDASNAKVVVLEKKLKEVEEEYASADEYIAGLEAQLAKRDALAAQVETLEADLEDARQEEARREIVLADLERRLAESGNSVETIARITTLEAEVVKFRDAWEAAQAKLEELTAQQQPIKSVTAPPTTPALTTADSLLSPPRSASSSPPRPVTRSLDMIPEENGSPTSDAPAPTPSPTNSDLLHRLSSADEIIEDYKRRLAESQEETAGLRAQIDELSKKDADLSRDLSKDEIPRSALDAIAEGTQTPDEGAVVAHARASSLQRALDDAVARANEAEAKLAALLAREESDNDEPLTPSESKRLSTESSGLVGGLMGRFGWTDKVSVDELQRRLEAQEAANAQLRQKLKSMRAKMKALEMTTVRATPSPDLYDSETSSMKGSSTPGSTSRGRNSAIESNLPSQNPESLQRRRSISESNYRTLIAVANSENEALRKELKELKDSQVPRSTSEAEIQTEATDSALTPTYAFSSALSDTASRPEIELAVSWTQTGTDEERVALEARVLELEAIVEAHEAELADTLEKLAEAEARAEVAASAPTERSLTPAPTPTSAVSAEVQTEVAKNSQSETQTDSQPLAISWTQTGADEVVVSLHARIAELEQTVVQKDAELGGLVTRLGEVEAASDIASKEAKELKLTVTELERKLSSKAEEAVSTRSLAPETHVTSRSLSPEDSVSCETQTDTPTLVKSEIQTESIATSSGETQTETAPLAISWTQTGLDSELSEADARIAALEVLLSERDAELKENIAKLEKAEALQTVVTELEQKLLQRETEVSSRSLPSQEIVSCETQTDETPLAISWTQTGSEEEQAETDSRIAALEALVSQKDAELKESVEKAEELKLVIVQLEQKLQTAEVEVTARSIPSQEIVSCETQTEAVPSSSGETQTESVAASSGETQTEAASLAVSWTQTGSEEVQSEVDARIAALEALVIQKDAEVKKAEELQLTITELEQKLSKAEAEVATRSLPSQEIASCETQTDVVVANTGETQTEAASLAVSWTQTGSEEEQSEESARISALEALVIQKDAELKETEGLKLLIAQLEEKLHQAESEVTARSLPSQQETLSCEVQTEPVPSIIGETQTEAVTASSGETQTEAVSLAISWTQTGSEEEQAEMDSRIAALENTVIQKDAELKESLEKAAELKLVVIELQQKLQTAEAEVTARSIPSQEIVSCETQTEAVPSSSGETQTESVEASIGETQTEAASLAASWTQTGSEEEQSEADARIAALEALLSQKDSELKKAEELQVVIIELEQKLSKAETEVAARNLPSQESIACEAQTDSVASSTGETQTEAVSATSGETQTEAVPATSGETQTETTSLAESWTQTGSEDEQSETDVRIAALEALVEQKDAELRKADELRITITELEEKLTKAETEVAARSIPSQEIVSCETQTEAVVASIGETQTEAASLAISWTQTGSEEEEAQVNARIATLESLVNQKDIELKETIARLAEVKTLSDDETRKADELKQVITDLEEKLASSRAEAEAAMVATRSLPAQKEVVSSEIQTDAPAIAKAEVQTEPVPAASGETQTETVALAVSWTQTGSEGEQSEADARIAALESLVSQKDIALKEILFKLEEAENASRSRELISVKSEASCETQTEITPIAISWTQTGADEDRLALEARVSELEVIITEKVEELSETRSRLVELESVKVPTRDFASCESQTETPPLAISWTQTGEDEEKLALLTRISTLEVSITEKEVLLEESYQRLSELQARSENLVSSQSQTESPPLAISWTQTGADEEREALQSQILLLQETVVRQETEIKEAQTELMTLQSRTESMVSSEMQTDVVPMAISWTQTGVDVERQALEARMVMLEEEISRKEVELKESHFRLAELQSVTTARSIPSLESVSCESQTDAVPLAISWTQTGADEERLALESRVVSLEMIITQKDTQLAETGSRLAEIQSREAAAKESLSLAKKRIDEYEKTTSSLQHTVTELQTQISTVRRNSTEIVSRSLPSENAASNVDLVAKNRELEEELESLRARLRNLSDLKAQLLDTASRHHTAEEMASAKKRIAELEDLLKRERAAFDSEVMELESKLASVTTEARESSSLLEQSKASIAKLEQEIQQLQQQHGEAIEEVRAARSLHESHKESSSRMVTELEEKLQIVALEHSLTVYKLDEEQKKAAELTAKAAVIERDRDEKLDELEKVERELAVERERLREYEAMEKELHIVRGELLTCSSRTTELEETIKKMETAQAGETAEREKEIQTLRLHIKELDEQAAEAAEIAAAAAKLEDDYRAEKAKLGEFEKEVSELRTTLETKIQYIMEVERELQSTKVSSSKVEEELQQSHVSKSQLESELAAARARLDEMRSELQSLVVETHTIIETTVIESQSNSGASERNIQPAMTELERLRALRTRTEELEAEVKELRPLRLQAEQLMLDSESSKKRCADLEQELENAKSRFSQFEEDMARKEIRSSELEADLELSRKELDKLRTELQTVIVETHIIETIVEGSQPQERSMSSVSSGIEELRSLGKRAQELEAEVVELRPLRLRSEQLLLESEDFKRRCADLESSLDSTTKRSIQIEEDLRQKEAHSVQLEADLDALRAQFSEMEKELQTIFVETEIHTHTHTHTHTVETIETTVYETEVPAQPSRGVKSISNVLEQLKAVGKRTKELEVEVVELRDLRSRWDQLTVETEASKKRCTELEAELGALRTVQSRDMVSSEQLQAAVTRCEDLEKDLKQKEAHSLQLETDLNALRAHFSEMEKELQTIFVETEIHTHTHTHTHTIETIETTIYETEAPAPQPSRGVKSISNVLEQLRAVGKRTKELEAEVVELREHRSESAKLKEELMGVRANESLLLEQIRLLKAHESEVVEELSVVKAGQEKLQEEIAAAKLREEQLEQVEAQKAKVEEELRIIIPKVESLQKRELELLDELKATRAREANLQHELELARNALSQPQSEELRSVKARSFEGDINPKIQSLQARIKELEYQLSVAESQGRSSPTASGPSTPTISRSYRSLVSPTSPTVSTSRSRLSLDGVPEDASPSVMSLWRSLAKAEDHSKKQAEEIKRLEDRIAELLQNVSEAKDALLSMEAIVSQVKGSERVAITKLADAEQEIIRYKAQAAELEVVAGQSKVEREKAMADAAAFGEERTRLERDVAAALTEIERLRKELDEARSTLSAEGAKSADLSEQLRVERLRIVTFETQITTIETELTKTKATLDEETSRSRGLSAEIEQLQSTDAARVKELEASVESLKAELAKVQAEKHELHLLVITKEEYITKLSSEKDHHVVRSRSLESEILAYQAKLSDSEEFRIVSLRNKELLDELTAELEKERSRANLLHNEAEEHKDRSLKLHEEIELHRRFIEENKSQHESLLESHRSSVQALELALDAERERIKSLETSANDHQQHAEALQRQLSSTTSNISDLQVQVAHEVEKRKEAEALLAAEKERSARLDDEAKESFKRTEELHFLIQSHYTQISVLEKRNAELTRTCDELRAALAAEHEKLANVQTTASRALPPPVLAVDFEPERKRLQSEIDALTLKVTSLEAQGSRTEEALKSALADAGSWRSKCEESSATLLLKENEVATLNAQLAKLQAEAREAVAKQQKTAEEVSRSKSENARLSAMVERLTQKVKELMEKQQRAVSEPSAPYLEKLEQRSRSIPSSDASTNSRTVVSTITTSTSWNNISWSDVSCEHHEEAFRQLMAERDDAKREGLELWRVISSYASTSSSQIPVFGDVTQRFVDLQEEVENLNQQKRTLLETIDSLKSQVDTLAHGFARVAGLRLYHPRIRFEVTPDDELQVIRYSVSESQYAAYRKALEDAEKQIEELTLRNGMAQSSISTLEIQIREQTEIIRQLEARDSRPLPPAKDTETREIVIKLETVVHKQQEEISRLTAEVDRLQALVNAPAQYADRGLTPIPEEQSVVSDSFSSSAGGSEVSYGNRSPPATPPSNLRRRSARYQKNRSGLSGHAQTVSGRQSVEEDFDEHANDYFLPSVFFNDLVPPGELPAEAPVKYPLSVLMTMRRVSQITSREYVDQLRRHVINLDLAVSRANKQILELQKREDEMKLEVGKSRVELSEALRRLAEAEAARESAEMRVREVKKRKGAMPWACLKVGGSIDAND